MGDELNNPELVETLAKGNIEFALDLYKHTSCHEENMLISPFSVSLVLGMTLGGAQGDTAAQIKETLHIQDLEDESVHSAFEDVLSSLKLEDHPGLTLLDAHRIYLQEDLEVQEDFATVLERHYGSSVAQVSFAMAAEETVSEINQWVEEQTSDKIQGFIADGMLDLFTVLVLVDAVFFRGEWDIPFEASDTHLRSFRGGGGRKVVVDTMRRTGEFRIADSEDLQCRLLEMPYSGGRLAFHILLPLEKDGLEHLEASLNGDALQGLLDSLGDPTPARVSLPRFHVDCFFSFSDILSQMGVTNLFNAESAELSGMTSAEEVAVSAVLHRSFLQVNEDGGDSPPEDSESLCDHIEDDEVEDGVVDFSAEHPFLFFIRDNLTGLILFLGRLKVPAE